VKRADDGGDRNTRHADVQPNRLQVELFNGLAYATVHLRQESAQGAEPLTTGKLAGGAGDEQSQVGFQATIDRIAESQGQRRGRGVSCWDAALELALLARER
jgi:hypothetical protein